MSAHISERTIIVIFSCFQVSFVTQGTLSDSKPKSVTFSITIAPPRSLAQYPDSYAAQAPDQSYPEFAINVSGIRLFIMV